MYATAAIGYLELQEETLKSTPLLGRLRALQLSKTHLLAVTAYRTSRTPALMHPPGCYSDSPRSRLAEPKTGGKGVGFYQSTLVVALG